MEEEPTMEDLQMDYDHWKAVTERKEFEDRLSQRSRSVNVDQRVMPESNGLLIEVPKIFYDSLIDCCNKLLDSFECADYRKIKLYKNGLRILLKR